MRRELHVAKAGTNQGNGNVDNPFLTIGQAVDVAEAGDKIVVHEGTYREYVNPLRGGTSEINRITYEAAEGEHVIIKGSERILGWENIEGSVWKVVLPNTFFGEFNPYKELLWGDWFIEPMDDSIHAGDVYLNGKSFYEAKNLEQVKNPQKRIVGNHPCWIDKEQLLLDPEGSIYQWFSEVTEKETIIYGNFHGANPNEELTEINVRQFCFYPEQTGINYITVKGFEMAQAACPWTPPTADQPGLLGAHWSKCWIIENNRIHDAKCSAISIGKERSTGHNLCLRYQQKPGYQYQMEAGYQALQMGWGKDTIGSHIIRNNTIYDCGQNGIVGHLGCIFSKIYNNHIYNIGVKHEFFGQEIAGIKLHAGIDVEIKHNRIHNCTLGTWLDWQAQGMRISSNLYYNNDRDFMIEVTSGPHLIDHNIFTSEYSIDNVAQGGAYVNNLILGKMRRANVLDRSTPYHFPHSTQVKGSAVVYGGDDRVYNNIFVGGYKPKEADCYQGTVGYNNCTASYEEYHDILVAGGPGDLEKFILVEQPVYIEGNVYLNGAEPFHKEEHVYCKESFHPEAVVVEEGEDVYLEITMEEEILQFLNKVQSTETLGTVRIADTIFDNCDGEEITLDVDLIGAKREEYTIAGPLTNLVAGRNRVKIW